MELRVPVQRLPRYGIPLVSVRINGYLVVSMALATSEPGTSLAPKVVEYLGFDLTELHGRRVIPSDAGPVIARTVRLERIELQLAGRRWLELDSRRPAVAMRPYALGVGGMLGLDVLARFPRIRFEAGPPDFLVLDDGVGAAQ